MAASLTLVSASPYALKYRYAHDGAGSQTAAVTKAQLLLDAATAGPGPSPLLAKLSATIDPEWSLLQEGDEVSVYVTPAIITAGTQTIAGLFGNPLAAGLKLLAVGLGQSSGDTAILEVRFNHTIDR